MPIFGLNSGMVPIISYNYGARRPKRVFSTMRVAYITAISYVLLCLCAFQLLPDQLLSIFNANETMLKIGRVALKTISWSFLFAGFSIISISACQALGKSIYSMFVSIARQLVVLIPVAFLLSRLGDAAVVWWAFPIAEIMSMIATVVFFVIVYKQIISKIPE
jgi:Na+-driven multidrug efflux pump